MSEQQTSRSRGDRGRIVPEHENEKSFDTSMGVFVLRRPSLATQMDIHKAAARNLEGLTNVDGAGESLNLMLATISVCARNGKERAGESPAGWPRGFSWESAYDWDFLSPLYREFMAWVASFRRTAEMATLKRQAMEEARTRRFQIRQRYNWGPTDPRYLSLTDRDVEREWWALYFFRLFESGKEGTAESVLEVHGDVAFDEAVREWEAEDKDDFEAVE